MHLRPPGRHIGIDSWPLILSFELKCFVCPHASIQGFQFRVCLTVCSYPEKRNHPGFVNISFTLVIDASIEKCSQVATPWKPKKFDFFFKNVRSWILTCAKSQNHLNFANITPTLVIYTSMERSSRVLQHGMLLIACHQNWLPLLYFLTGACLPDSFCCHIL